jgi:hypothetical protein
LRNAVHYDVYAQRISAAGTALWTTDGIPLCTATLEQQSIAITSDGAGGAIVTWEDFRDSFYAPYAQLVDSTGTVQWTIPGVLLGHSSSDQRYPKIAPDGTGGAIVAWLDYRGGGNESIYANKIDGSGTVQWTNLFTAICSGSSDQNGQQIVSDGADGTIVFWEDRRDGEIDVFAQRIDASGLVQWLSGGVFATGAVGSQAGFGGVSDGAGGVIVSWYANRDYQYDVYAQRFGASGAVLWGTDGVTVCEAAAHQDYTEITSDGAGGAIITWRDSRDGSYDIYAQRINATGTALWTTDGVPLCTATNYQWAPVIVSDGMGGAIVAWRDNRSGEFDIYVQRVDASGIVQWTTDGVALCTATGAQSMLQIESDGAGGAIVTWQDTRGSAYEVYAQRINASGAVQWTTDGVALSDSLGSEPVPQITTDGAGGAIVTWYDQQGSAEDIYAQCVNASGTIQWPADGVPICEASGNQNSPQIASDGTGGAIVTWVDARDGGSDIYAQSVDSLGTAQWVADGVAVCTAFGDQLGPQLISDGAGGAYVTWHDERSSQSRVYVQRATDAGMGPICQVDPETIAIPIGVQAGTSFDTTFTVTNIGSGTLIGYIDEACDDFDVVSGGGAYNLYNGQSHVVAVRFAPTTAGTFHCTVDPGTHLCSDVSITGTAYACPPDSVLYVEDNAVGANDGTSWMDAFTSLQDALARAALCENVRQIWVADGTYYPTDGTSRDTSFVLPDTLSIYGGFAGTETMLSERNLLANASILSGDIGVPGNRSDNSYRVVVGYDVDNATILDGFTITGGNAEAASPSGAGMYLQGSSPTILNIIFRDNTAKVWGGGMLNTSGSAPQMYNVVFFHNTAGGLGGGMCNDSSVPVIVNATFNRNRADDGGAGIFNEASSNAVLTNVVMWDDSTSSMTLPEIANHAFSYPVISYSLVMDCGGSGPGWESSYGTDGGHNLDEDPRFVDASTGDLHLTGKSDAVDSGDSTVAGLPATDLDGQQRVQGLNVDMGAYEGGFDVVRVGIDTDPSHLDVIVDGDTMTTWLDFYTRSGALHEIGTFSPQFQGEIIYSFTGWSDGGDTTHTIIVPDVEDTTYVAIFTWAYTCATIDSIVDVPGDQGGWVRTYFRRSHYDDASEPDYPITHYNLHRRVDEPELVTSVLSDGEAVTEDVAVKLADTRDIRLSVPPPESGSRYLRYEDRYFVLTDGEPAGAPPGLWEVVETILAQQQAQYIALAPTLADSAETLVYSVYYISAHTTTPAVFFDSPPDSGYSVDNIAPGVPQGFAVAYNTGIGNQLAWDPCADPDFQYFKIYRDTDPDFVPGPGNEVHATADVSWTDPEYDGWNVHYKITALDHVGNESPAASPDTETGAPIPVIPQSFALYQNVPNPFNPSTTIAYDVPAGGGKVTLRVYDVAGRLVRTLVDGTQPAGQKTVGWDGANGAGKRAASGVYFYRMTAPGFTQTRKMVLLQ